jgi:hypothetical protein
MGEGAGLAWLDAFASNLSATLLHLTMHFFWSETAGFAGVVAGFYNPFRQRPWRVVNPEVEMKRCGIVCGP